jgi:hypothetical protein
MARRIAIAAAVALAALALLLLIKVSDLHEWRIFRIECERAGGIPLKGQQGKACLNPSNLRSPRQVHV